MSDVLGMVEEALEDLLPSMREALSEPERRGYSALTALRGLAWRPLLDLDDTNHKLFYAGRWLDGEWDWNILHSRAFAMACGYTHFCRPILPAPPKREVG